MAQLNGTKRKSEKMEGPTMRVAFEGCGHGTLHDIYGSVTESAKMKGWNGVDLVVIGGDFQAVRNSNDLSCMAVPHKYKQIGDFQEYYSGARVAPYLTIFIGGNHEASNYLSELYYGGWVAPNIYYMGAAGVIRCGPLRIAGLSGIWKGYDYRKPRFERLPYDYEQQRSIYHVRKLDARKLLQIRTQVDLGLSHDWPRKAPYYGDIQQLLRDKPFFREDVENQRLGSVAAQEVLDRLRPYLWFSAHLHCKFVATIQHDKDLKLEDVLPSVHPKQDPVGEPKEVVNAEQDKINAWKQFYQVAAQQDKEDTQQFIDERAEHYRKVDAGEASAASANTFNLTWKKVDVGEDSLDRHVTGTIKPQAERDVPSATTVHAEQHVKNADEIDLDADSASETGVPEPTAGVTEESTSSQPMDTEPTVTAPETESQGIESENATKEATDIPAGGTSGSTVPTNIVNLKTDFFALDKCGKKRNFLQLLDVPVTGDKDDLEKDRPYQLEYDKEWLAITRVFADELVVGDHLATVPPDRGEAKYREEILEAEKWVEENIVSKGKMTIPNNFTMTAPVYDPAVPVWTTEQPPEYLNPQTEEFCELVGIENKFRMTDEAREAQNAEIKQFNEGTGQHNQDFKSSGHHRGGRGGRRGRGRGRGGRGGRGGRRG